MAPMSPHTSCSDTICGNHKLCHSTSNPIIYEKKYSNLLWHLILCLLYPFNKYFSLISPSLSPLPLAALTLTSLSDLANGTFEVDIHRLGFWLILTGILVLFDWIFGSVFAMILANFSGYFGGVWLCFWEYIC